MAITDDEIGEDDDRNWLSRLGDDAGGHAATEAAIAPVEVASDVVGDGCGSIVGDGCGGCGLDAGCFIAFLSAALSSVLIAAVATHRLRGNHRRRG